ncbi:MAG: ATP-binding cassette domain-containing protein [Zestosphaera sp.]
MPVIEFRNYYWKYSLMNDWALADINLTIHRGEFVCITGPNESGKTTLAMSMNALIPHNYQGVMRGEVLIFGEDSRKLHPSQVSRRVGLVFSDPESQFLTMSVEEEIAFGPENLGLDIDEISRRILWALKLTKLSEDLLDKPPYELSGGQKQRVAIAAILAMKPEVIILDEPTSMLDPLGKAEVLEVLKRLREELNSTIIVIEHRLEDIAPLATRFILLNKGRIVKDADPREFFDDIDFLLANHVNPPEFMVVLNELRRGGLYSGRVPLRFDEGLEVIRRLLSHD